MLRKMISYVAEIIVALCIGRCKYIHDDVIIMSYLHRARMVATVSEDSHTQVRLQYLITTWNLEL